MLTDVERLLRRLGLRAARQAPVHARFAAHGVGSWLCPPVEVVGAEGIEVGAGVVLLDGCALRAAPGARLALGDGVRLGRMCTIAATRSVVLGARVSSSDFAVVTDSWGPVAVPGPVDTAVPALAPAPVVIGDGAYLGCGSVVGPGVTVGAGAYVGEGAVVVEDVAPHAVVFGNPARVVRTA